MFDTLPAATTVGAPWSRAAIAASALHVLLIAAAVGSTTSPNAGASPIARDTIRLEMTRLAEPSTPMESGPPRSSPEAVIPELPRVPDLDLAVPELQLSPLRINLVRSESSATYLGRQPGESRASSHSLPSDFSAAEVDQLPELVGEVRLRYPSELRRDGVSGLVQVQYVVGADGRVDERTIRVLSSSHPAFLLAALQALGDSRFMPARQGGRPTAVLVEQTFRFRAR